MCLGLKSSHARTRQCLLILLLALAGRAAAAADLLPNTEALLKQCQEFVRTTKTGRLVIHEGDQKTIYYEGRGALTRARDQCIHVLYARPAGTRFGEPCAPAYAARLQKAAGVLKQQSQVARDLGERVERVIMQLDADLAALAQAKRMPVAIRGRCKRYAVAPRKGLRIVELATASEALNAALAADDPEVIRAALVRVHGAWWQLAERLRWSQINVTWAYQDLRLAAGFIEKHPNHEYVGAILDVPGMHDLVERFFEIKALIAQFKRWLKERDDIDITEPARLHVFARKPYAALLNSVADQPRTRAALAAALRTPYECLFLGEQLRRYEQADVISRVSVLCARWTRSTPKQADMAQEVRSLLEVLCDRQGSTEPQLKIGYRFHQDLMDAGEALAGKSRSEAFTKVLDTKAGTLYERLRTDTDLAKTIFGQTNLACYRRANVFATALANGGFGGSYPFLARWLRLAGQRPTRHNVVGFDLGTHRAFSETGVVPAGRRGFPVPVDIQDTKDAYVFGHSFYRSLTAWVAERYYLPPDRIVIRAVPYYGQVEKVETVTAADDKE